MNSNQKAAYIVTHSQLMVLATADEKGKPWASPLGYYVDEDFNFYWYSDKDAQHSQNLRQRPAIAAVITGKDDEDNLDAVYLEATASELTTDSDLDAALKFLATQPEHPRFKVSSKTDVSGSAAWRIYKAIPQQFWKHSAQTKDGQAVAVREPVTLQ